MSEHHHHAPRTDEDPTAFWEGRYAEQDEVWSGHPNQALVDEVGDLPPGAALDLGCGEGGDALWLAGRGWMVTALDISPTALDRTVRAAGAAGLAERVTGVVADLADPATWPSAAAYDLVTACFLQSPLDFPRAEVLRHAAALVGPGGRLLVVAHAAKPPWADLPDDVLDSFPTPQGELAVLALDEAWDVEVAEAREREATGPDGEQAVLLDSVVRVARR